MHASNLSVSPTQDARRRLPNRRLAESSNFECGGLEFTLTFGRDADGNVAEIFLNGRKSNSASDANARDGAIAASLGLQYGVPLEVLRRALTRDDHGNAVTPLGIAVDIAAEDKAA
jgi:hypothetical protein